jgi:hypothetical protein
MKVKVPVTVDPTSTIDVESNAKTEYTCDDAVHDYEAGVAKTTIRDRLDFTNNWDVSRLLAFHGVPEDREPRVWKKPPTAGEKAYSRQRHDDQKHAGRLTPSNPSA